MNWLSIAILSAAILGIVSIIDSHLLSRRMPSLGTFLLPVGIIHGIYGSLLFILFPFPEGLGALPLGAGVAAGILRAGGATIMLYTMTREEVSRVIPVVYTYPIFVAIMAVVLLDESLSYLQWLAIIVVAAGAVMASLKRSSDGSGARLSRSFALLLTSSLLLAASDVASKYALSYISSWNMYSLSVFCMSLLFLIISLRSRTLRELRAMKGRNPALALLAFNETLAPVGIILTFWAIERGPVSLVSTILSSRPLFVLIYALILGRALPVFLEWRPSRATLLLRLTATAMIVGGIAIIYLL